MAQAPTGTVYIVAAPSGAGKSSLVAALLAKQPTMALSVSYTTRAPRPGEENGREYHFATRDEFESRLKAGEFLEHAEVFGNLYGTSRLTIESTIAAGGDVLLEIDWQGARQVRRHFPESVGVFILPPSMPILKERLEKRGTDSRETIARRLQGAGAEMEHAVEFEYVIINQDFPAALEQLTAIVSATRLRYRTQAVRHAEVFSGLGIGLLSPLR